MGLSCVWHPDLEQEQGDCFTLEYYGIRHECVLVLDLVQDIFISTPGADTFRLRVNLELDAIATVKAQIAKSLNIGVCDQTLLFVDNEGSMSILIGGGEDGRSLADYNVNAGFTLQLVRSVPSC